MACVNCGSSESSGLFSGNRASTKNIKFECAPTGANLSVFEGSRAKAKMELCDFSKSYNQFFSTEIFIEGETSEWETTYGGIGSHATFVAVRVKYLPNKKNPCNCQNSTTETPYLSYRLKGSNEVRYIDDIMILSGTADYPIPPIIFSNSNTQFDAEIEFIASNDIKINKDIESMEGDDILTVQNLTFKSLHSTADTFTIESSAGTVVALRWQDIEFYDNITLNGKIVVIEDYVRGTVNLSFNDVFNAQQGFSLIKWALQDTAVNLLTGDGNTADTEPPVIAFGNPTESIILAEFPPVIASTCGTSGTEMCDIPYSAGTQGVILKEDLFRFLDITVSDNRDNISIDYSSMVIQEVGKLYTQDAIDSLGYYSVSVTATDNAQNTATESFILNVKDTDAPKIIASDALISVISSTSGYVIAEGSFALLSDGFGTFDYKVGDTGYLIINDKPVLHTSDLSTVTIDAGVYGDTVQSFAKLTEQGIEKNITIHSIVYGFTYNGGENLITVREI